MVHSRWKLGCLVLVLVSLYGGSLAASPSDAKFPRQPEHLSSSEQAPIKTPMDHQPQDSWSDNNPSIPQVELDGPNRTFLILVLGVGLSSGLLLLVFAVALILICRRRKRALAKKTKEKVLNCEPVRLDFQVHRADPYDVNRTMSGIPTITDIWREMQLRS